MSTAKILECISKVPFLLVIFSSEVGDNVEESEAKYKAVSFKSMRINSQNCYVRQSRC